MTKVNLPEGRTAVHVGDVVQGPSTIPRRGRLNLLLAAATFVVIAAVVALQVWTAPLTTSGVEAQDANLKAGAGSAIVHDDAGNMP